MRVSLVTMMYRKEYFMHAFVDNFIFDDQL